MDNVFIKVLRFARDNPGFEQIALLEKFPDDYAWIIREYDHGKLFQTVGKGEERRFYLSFDDWSRLLEHDELVEARMSSRRAMYFASVSILIAACGLILSVLTK